MTDDLFDSSIVTVDSDGDAHLDLPESLVPIRERKHAGTTIVTLDGLLEQQPLKLEEDLKEGCGGQLWPAGILLARYMLQKHSSDLLGKTMSVLTTSLLFSAIPKKKIISIYGSCLVCTDSFLSSNQQCRNWRRRGFGWTSCRTRMQD
jgi:hypothetical protein